MKAMQKLVTYTILFMCSRNSIIVISCSFQDLKPLIWPVVGLWLPGEPDESVRSCFIYSGSPPHWTDF